MQPAPAPSQSSGAVCPEHPERQATGTCLRCGRFVCEPCAGEERTCPSCIDQQVSSIGPTEGRARWSIRFLALHAITDVAGIAIALFALSGPMPEGELSPLVWAESLLAIPLIVAALGTPIVFLMWLHRVVRKVRAMGLDAGATPGWAVGYWFIPFANLVKPYHVVRNVISELGGESAVSAARLQAWWAFWILGNIASQVETRMSTGLFGDAAVPVAAREAGIVASALTAVGAWLCIGVIRTIERSLKARAG